MRKSVRVRKAPAAALTNVAQRKDPGGDVTSFGTEIGLCRVVNAWLCARRWDVHQEVRPFVDGPVADLVAVKNDVPWVIAAKLTVSLRLLTQASAWRAYGKVSIAVPARSLETAEWVFVRSVLEWQRIGVLFVSGRGVAEEVGAPLVETEFSRVLLGALRGEHRQWAEAGNRTGARFTDFQDTRAKIRTAVLEKPGMTLRQVVSAAGTHWGSSASAIQWIKALGRDGRLPGVRCERRGGIYRLYPAEPE